MNTMADDKDSTAVTAATAATTNSDNNNQIIDNSNSISKKRRRMSKRERKNLKKKKLAVVAKTTTTSSIAKHEDESTPTHEEYMINYIPAPLAANDTTTSDDIEHTKSLGKWFPSASVIKSSICYSNDYLAKLVKDGKKQSSAANAKEEEPKASLVLFYQYVSPPWSPTKVSSFISYLSTIGTSHRTNIGGRIRISTEGVNATVSAASTTSTSNDNSNDSLSHPTTPTFEAAQTLRHFTQDLKNFDPTSFQDTDFKYIDGLTADRHFKELKLLPVKELVFYDIREDDCTVATAAATTKNTTTATTDDGDGEMNADDNDANRSEGGRVVKTKKEIKGGIHLKPKEYHEMLKRNDAVVIDVRNHYEAAIGRFDGQMLVGRGNEDVQGLTTTAAVTAGKFGGNESNHQMKKRNDDGDEKEEKEDVDKVVATNGGGAEYIDPKMRKSTDFTSWLSEPKTKEKLAGKTVMMFCTGGIRCERASAYLNSQMGSDVKGVYQLQGGIERYLQAFPEGGFWRGKNFVFDKREAISAGNINGDGGVIRKDNISDDGGGNNNNKKSVCANCSKPWDRYIGKRKCFTCGVPVLVCDTCLSMQSSTSAKKKKKKKKAGKEKEDGAVKPKVLIGDAKKTDTASIEEVERIRCPLCVEEGVTVPAADVEYTDNGVRSRQRSSSFTEGGGPSVVDEKTKDKQKTHTNNNKKTAKSVLKWGGGHATKKKEKRKWSKKLCQFGSECVRKDCFFYHPEREHGKK